MDESRRPALVDFFFGIRYSNNLKNLNRLILAELYKSRKTGAVDLLERFPDFNEEEINKAARDLAGKELVWLNSSAPKLYISPEAFVTRVSSGKKYLMAELTEMGVNQATPLYLRRSFKITALFVLGTIGAVIAFANDFFELLERFGIMYFRE